MFKRKQNALLLIVRLIIGGLFIVSGWMKISDMASTIQFFSMLHIPAFLAFIVGYSEFLGGLMVVLGICTEYAGSVLAMIMIVAITLTLSGGLQAFGMPLMTLTAIIGMLASGPGTLVVPFMWCKK